MSSSKRHSRHDLANKTNEEIVDPLRLNARPPNRSVAKRSKTLARHESTREVYIGPDLTRKERLANKDLREELKARRARGEEDIFIRRNEIVTAPPLLVAPPMLAAPQAAAPVAQAAAPQAAAPHAAAPVAQAVAPQAAAPVAQAAAPQAAAPVAQAAVPAPKN